MIESKTLGGRLGVLSLHKEPLAIWKEREDANRLSEMGSSVISEVVNRGRKEREKNYKANGASCGRLRWVTSAGESMGA